MITLVSRPKQHLPKDMQHSVHTNFISYYDFTVVDLPHERHYSDELLATSTGKSLYFFDISGSNTIYELDCGQFFCSWDQMPQNMTTPRSDYTMMFIPKSLANCA